MKIVIAPDSFKESISALDVANAVEEGFQEVFPIADIVKVPMADGGEGLVHSLVHSLEGHIIKQEVTGPLGERVDGFFGLIHDGKTAVIEMAAASGLHLVPQRERNPLYTTTYGVGELISAAMDHHVNKIILGLGGSATNDGGAGMVMALGCKLVDKHGNAIGYGGGSLSSLYAIDKSSLDPRLSNVTFEVACDVENPLLGPSGASFVFGPQKGATNEMVKILDQNLSHFATVIERDLGEHVSDIPGSGAAGGLGAALQAFFTCHLRKGIEIVIEATRLEDHMKDASLVITGEGKIDNQTIYGKTPIGVAKVAKKHNVPVIGLAGSLSTGYEAVYDYGIDAVFSIAPGIISLKEALSNTYQNIYSTTKNIAKVMEVIIYNQKTN